MPARLKSVPFIGFENMHDDFRAFPRAKKKKKKKKKKKITKKIEKKTPKCHCSLQSVYERNFFPSVFTIALTKLKCSSLHNIEGNYCPLKIIDRVIQLGKNQSTAIILVKHNNSFLEQH